MIKRGNQGTGAKACNDIILNKYSSLQIYIEL